MATLGTFAWALRSRSLDEARNLAFTVLVFGELFRAFAARSATRLFWEMGAFTNVTLLGVVLVSAFLQIGIHHIPGTERFFQIGTISLEDCMLSLLIGLVPVSAVELSKLVRRFPHAPGEQRTPEYFREYPARSGRPADASRAPRKTWLHGERGANNTRDAALP